MRVALVYPPLADATQPYSSLAALAGFLRARGNHEAVLHDANLEFLLHMLTRERIAGDDFKAAFVREGIDDAVAALRSPETFRDLARLRDARRVVGDALELLEPVRLESWSAEDLERAARSNVFSRFFEEVTLPRLAADAIGISITYRRQIVPALTLALLIRERMPGVPVIFGGQIASLWHAVADEVPRLFDWCDYLIAFEGETALEALLTALERRGSLDEVPNLAHRGGVNRLHVEDIDALPTPDYRGLPLDRYLAPEPVLLLNTSRGCYWSRCAFCSVSPSMRHRFRMRRPELVLEDVATLQARHGLRCLSFGDDCVPPRMLKSLADGVRNVSWQCEARFERRLDAPLLAALANAGCRNLIFGLESYAPHVLEAMDKGVRHADIRRILDDCRRNGIAFNLQFFFGFPGEREADARQTMDFVAGQMHGAATASFGTFRLQRGSGVARHPDSFGIRIAGDQQPLAVELAYEPLPSHAEAVRAELDALLRRRLPSRGLFLGLDAHTLLYLHHAGVPAMARDQYASPRAAHRRRVARRAHQSLTGPVLYDYELDRAVELSPLALWLLEQLEHPRSPRELARKLATATRESPEGVLPAVDGILTSLRERGMIEAR